MDADAGDGIIRYEHQRRLKSMRYGWPVICAIIEADSSSSTNRSALQYFLSARHILPLGPESGRRFAARRLMLASAGSRRFARGELRHLGDIEGRLIWASTISTSVAVAIHNDLIRLAASALMAEMIASPGGIDAIIGGYRESLEAGGRPYVLASPPGAAANGHRALHDPDLLGQTACFEGVRRAGSRGRHKASTT